MRKFKFGILSLTLLAVFTSCQEKNDGGLKRPGDRVKYQK
jgi:hypothetical protein